MLERRILDEGDFKSIVLNEYRCSTPDWRHNVVANEYPLGTSSVRVDLAIFGTEFVGIEIKSERDSLKRLANQVDAYSRYFDRVVVVLADRHLRSLDWKSVRVAEVWKIDRSGRLGLAAQPSTLGEAHCLSDLLNHQQLRKHGLLDRVAIDDELARQAFRAEFRSRFGPTSQAFWEATEGRPIGAEDLNILSRFRDRRASIVAWEEQRAVELQRWISAVESLGPSALHSDQSSSVS